jgi:hypothetical protein
VLPRTLPPNDMSLSLPAYRGSTVGVSVLPLGNVTIPTSLYIQSPVSGHDTLDLPVYSFLVENKQAHKKVLFDLGIMKDWKEKRPERGSSLLPTAPEPTTNPAIFQFWTRRRVSTPHSKLIRTACVNF